MTASPKPRPRPSLRLRLILSAFACGFGLLTVEVLFHLAPGLLPTWFRERYPPHGVEFLDPGVLDRTPLTSLPLPYGVVPYDGPPPHDLVDFGVAAPPEVARDRADVPRLVLPADALGLPNASPPQRPAVALVGDSFTVFGAQLEPPGLQQQLASLLGREILNAAISGIGPDHELFLLERVVVPAKPRLVVWMFFGGNDLIDCFWSQTQKGLGIRTLGELFADRRAPRWILPSLLAGLFGPGVKPMADPLPGFVLPGPGSRRLWFYPETLRSMAMPAEWTTTNAGWAGIRAALTSAKERCTAFGARFLVVYLPSKEQIYLPRVVADAGLLQRFVAASTLQALPVPQEAGELMAAVLRNRGALEAAVADLCATAEIEYWSATPTVDALADSGVACYYATDSHWRAEAQRATADALHAQITARGLLPR